MVTGPVESLRTGIQRALHRLVSADEEPRQLADRSDEGLFGPHSAVWVVHSDLSMFIGGLRALLLQTLHPLVMAGVYEHSNYKQDPLGRLQRTAEFVGTTTFGTVAEAEAMTRRIRAVHRPITGIAPDGRPYDATDPHLLEWVHLTEIDSFLRAHQRYGAAPLGPIDADRYVAEMAEVADRLGVADTAHSVSELRTRLVAYRPELHVGAQAHDTVRFLLRPMLDLRSGPAYATVMGAAIGLLPPFVRRMLWLPLAPGVDPLVVRPTATALLRLLGWALDESPELAAARQRARDRSSAAAV